MSSKITVIMLFGLRLPNIAFMAITASSFKSIRDAEHTQPITDAAVWSQVLLGYALSSASFPCIRSFLTAFLADSKYRVHGTTSGGSGAYGSNSRSGRQKNTHRSAKVASVIEAMPNQHLSDEAGSVASDASQRMMIERSVEIYVAVESADTINMATQDSRPEFPYQGGRPNDLYRRESRNRIPPSNGQ